MRIEEVKKLSFILFIIGLFAGVIYINLIARTYVLTTEIFDRYWLEEYSVSQINNKEYMLYILKIRIVPIILLIIMGTTIYKRAAACVCVLWTGLVSGIILTISVLKLSIKGIVFCIVATLPHFICYIAAYTILLLYMFTYPSIRWNGSKTISISVFMLLGIISECYVNPVLIDIFIKTF